MSRDSSTALRTIGLTGFTTPLLVPSYSSRGFSPIKPKFDFFSPHTTSASLVSAYDIHHKALSINAAYGSDIVFLDSGGYEAYSNSELSTPKQWSLSEYRAVLSQLEDRTTIVPVTFDFENRRPTREQLEAAAQLALDFPRFQWDCLIKPESPALPWVNVEAVLELIPSAPPFAILGFAEMELGSSILERARNVLRVRRTLSEHGKNPPIHLFGCLDPHAIRYYLAAGADIFDGLQWLRSVMTEEGLFRMSSRIVHENRWDTDETTVEAYFRIRNLEVMSRLQRNLTNFAKTGEVAALRLNPIEEERFKRLMTSVNDGGKDVRN